VPKLPDLNEAVVREVMDSWDTGPASPAWRGFDWQRPGRHKTAVRYAGRLYPVKEVIRRAVHKATGDWVDLGLDKEGAVQWVCSRGFTVTFAPFRKPYDGPPRARPRYTIVLSPDESGGWFAEMPALQACYAGGTTIEEAVREVHVVYDLIMGIMDDEGEVPPPDIAVPILAAAS
jgi:predicted RNase H-like HicB family nuclease